MSKHVGDVDLTHYVTLRPAISRAFWTAARAWNGTKVGLVIETRWVPDGTDVEISIVADRGPTNPIETLPAAKVQKNKCTVYHQLSWTHEELGGVPLDGPPVRFHFIVAIKRFELQARSNGLYVDTGSWSHSS